MNYKILLLTIVLSLNNLTFSQEKYDEYKELMIYISSSPQKSNNNLRYDNLWQFQFLQELQPKDDLKVGYMNESGDIIISPKYNMGSDFYGEYANIIKDSIFGYIDKYGNETLLGGYDEAYFYYSKSGIAKKNGKYALINREGDPLTEFKYENIDFFGYNFYKVYLPDKTNQIIDYNGDIVFNKNKNFQIISSYFEKDSIIIFKKMVEGKELNGLVTLKDEIILKPFYERIVVIKKDGLYGVMINGKWGFIDKLGNEIIPPIYVDANIHNNDDLIAVKKKDKWGYINRQNKIIIPFMYDKAYDFDDNRAFVKKGDYYGYINKRNKVKIEFKLEPIATPSFSNKLALFKKEGKYGFINKKGEVQIPAIYDNAFRFYDGKAHVLLNGKVGFINLKGKVIIPIEYKQIWFESEGMLRYLQ